MSLDTAQGEATVHSFKSMLQEHFLMVVQHMEQQQVHISKEIDAKMQAVSIQMTATVTAAVQTEVAALDSKFRALLDNSSSVHSGSQLSSVSSCPSHVSALTQSVSGINRQHWLCPVCQTPLKHEKSFYDHLALLLSRVHELPVISGKRRKPKFKKCLFNIERPDHVALLQPWASAHPTFWSQAHEFVRFLLMMLKPGSEHATSDDNPRHAVVFKWVDDCRSGVFVPL